MKKILIAPNSFKGSADSVTAAEYFIKYLNGIENCELIVKPISDGGDGFLNVCRKYYNLKDIRYSVSTPFDESEINCETGYDETVRSVYVESAKILGLNIIPSSERDPLRLNSRGIGDILVSISGDVRSKKINPGKVFIGIGGTGTNDLGLGALSRFGLKLIDNQNNELKAVPGNFRKVKDLEWNNIDLPFRISCIIDVENSLIGEQGATKVFAGQKGASLNDIEIMEEGFHNLINIFRHKKLLPEDKLLYGAGGGLAAGLSVFLNAEVITAEEFLMKNLGFEKLKDEVDYLITGEGSFDPQSIMKKGTWILIMNFQHSAEMIFLCCGTIEDKVKSKLNPKIIPIEFTRFFDSGEDSVRNLEKGIKSAVGEIRKYVVK